MLSLKMQTGLLRSQKSANINDPSSLSQAVKLLDYRAIFAANVSQSIVGYLSEICALYIA